MAPRYRNPLGALALAWLLAPLAAAQFKNDFSLYPSGTQGCLDDAAARSQCTGNNARTMNTCLCSDSGKFVTNSAICIGREVPFALQTVWNNMNTACTDSGQTIAIPSDTFIRMGQAEMGTPSTRTTAVSSGTPSTAASTPTTLLTSQMAESSPTGTDSPPPDEPSSTGVNDDDLPPPTNMSIAVMAGIGVAGAVVAGLIGGVAFIIWKRRKANKLDPRARFYHLPDNSNNGTPNPTLREWKATDPYSPHGPPPPSSGGLSVPGQPGQMTGLGVSSAVSPVTATATSPYPPSTAWTAHSPQAGWGNYHSPTWTGSPVFPQGSAPGAFAELPSDRQAAHELDSIEVPRPPVEMPAPYEGPGQSGPVWADVKPTKS
ncbi:hypothetical protein F5X68DRAFT_36539 [Plectosphaerella plurivora]|uniref:Uncharacterized protein n=1 Tax=Plectosphaerella plurivora TaxID=936078 RepID=A0A9P8V5W1_9PEZI|nr:hypothetical protein F5X68DRAFT_36539 [Plectosphaerella plurivora]